jgi:hypothetical protein
MRVETQCDMREGQRGRQDPVPMGPLVRISFCPRSMGVHWRGVNKRWHEYSAIQLLWGEQTIGARVNPGRPTRRCYGCLGASWWYFGPKGKVSRDREETDGLRISRRLKPTGCSQESVIYPANIWSAYCDPDTETKRRLAFELGLEQDIGWWSL